MIRGTVYRQVMGVSIREMSTDKTGGRRLSMKLTGAEIFIECLKREGVKTLFALPGGVVLKIFDMLTSAEGHRGGFDPP